MIELPVVDATPPTPRPQRPWLAWSVHLLRVIVLIAIVLMIRETARQRTLAISLDTVEIPLTLIRNHFPSAMGLGPIDPENGSRLVLDANEIAMGYVIQTSPAGDEMIGFSGPTNTMVAFNTEHKIIGLSVISSRDTREHVAEVVQHEAFMKSLNGKTWSEAANVRDVDGVSGATLTSVAMMQSVLIRLGGEPPGSLKFPDQLTVDDVTPLFEGAHRIKLDADRASLWHVFDQSETHLGSVLRTSPVADNVVGYQGPTDCLIVLDAEEKVTRLWVRTSFDNEPYVGYLNQDWGFRGLFEGLILSEVADYDLEANNIEGVSGATMTSIAVANGIVLTAQDAAKPVEPKTKDEPEKAWALFRNWSMNDFGAVIVILFGLAMAFTKARGNKILRVLFQLTVLIYLGVINGALLSQAMFVGWTQNGIPLESLSVLILLAAVSLLLPVFTKTNIYCAHLCPHGALQQLVRNRFFRSRSIPVRLKSVLAMIPATLLLWVVIVAMCDLGFSLVDIEPFDAYLFSIAGWATIGVVVVGFLFSLFVPMGYCRFGCPTGAVLEWLRRHRRSDEFQTGDAVALLLLLLTLVLNWSA